MTLVSGYVRSERQAGEDQVPTPEVGVSLVCAQQRNAARATQMQPVMQLELKAVFQDRQVGISKQRTKIQAKLPSLDQKSIATARQFQGGAENAESSTSNVPTHLNKKEAQRIVVACLFSKAGSWETVTDMLQQRWVSEWHGWQELQQNLTEEMCMHTAKRFV